MELLKFILHMKIDLQPEVVQETYIYMTTRRLTITRLGHAEITVILWRTIRLANMSRKPKTEQREEIENESVERESDIRHEKLARAREAGGRMLKANPVTMDRIGS